MTEEERRKFVEMCPRVFVRAVRDPNQSAGEEYELSEGQAASLLRDRERAALTAFLGALGENVERFARKRWGKQHGSHAWDQLDDTSRAMLRHAAREDLAALKEMVDE